MMTVRIVTNPQWYVRVDWQSKNRVRIEFERRDRK